MLFCSFFLDFSTLKVQLSSSSGCYTRAWRRVDPFRFKMVKKSPPRMCKYSGHMLFVYLSNVLSLGSQGAKMH